MKSIVNCIAIVISFFAICVESQGADVKSSRVPKNSIEEVDGIVTISVFIDKRVEPKVKELEGTAMLRTNRLLRRQFKALPRNFSLPVSVERADYDANEEIYTYVTKIRRSDIEEWILNYKEEEKQRIAAEKAAAEKAAAEKAAAEKAAAEKAAAEKAAAEKAAAEKAAAEKAAAEKAAAEKAAAEKAAAEKAAAEKAAAEKAAAEKAAAEKAAAEKAAAEKAAAEKAAAEKAAAEKAAAEKAAAEKAAAEKAAAEKAEAEKLAVARAAAQKVVEARRNLEAKERSQNDEKGHVRIVQPASPREDDLGVKGGNDSLIEESKSKSLGELKPETAEEAEQRNANENKMADDAIMNLFK